MLTDRPLARFVPEPAPGAVNVVLAPTAGDLPVLAQGDGWVLAGREPFCG